MTETVCAYLLGSNPQIRQEVAKQLGKKGIVSDIALYNYAKDFTLQVVDPVRYPDKALTLFQTIFMADVP
ncbi:MAG: elongation factor Tu, partial [Candidatus Heimdallarchaeaceae archaeon]